MSSHIQVVTPAASGPLAIADALRLLCALEGDVDMVQHYLLAATATVEDYCGLSLINATFELVLDRWPDGTLFELPRTPLSSITSVKYYADGDTVQTTLSTDSYRAITGRLPGALEIVEDVVLPTLAVRQDAVTIRFVAGHGTTPESVPAPLRTAVLQLARLWYDERRPISEAKNISVVPYTLQFLLRAYRVDSQLSFP